MALELTVLTAEQWALLTDAHAKYEATVSPHYDEVLHEVAARAAAVASIGKADIGALLFWKRLRADTTWVAGLHAIPESEVRRHTSQAMTLVNDQELSLSDAAGAGRGALSPLPGFVGGDALASAVLLAMAPTRMAVYDKRGHAALAKLGIGLVNSQGRYRRFMQIVDDLVRSQPPSDRLWTPRDIDTALYQLGSSR